MEICFSSNVPDDTYFRVGEVEPKIDGHVLTLYDGDGRHRSWGHPGVTSTVVVDAIDFVAVHVGFHHKHGVGQFWRFYNVNGLIEQVAWKALPDETRQIVLDAIEAGKAPSWARSPGKVRKDYDRPSQHKFTAYKQVNVSAAGFAGVNGERPPRRCPSPTAGPFAFWKRSPSSKNSAGCRRPCRQPATHERKSP